MLWCVCIYSCRVPMQTCESLHVPAFLGWCSRARPSLVSSRGMLWGASGPCCSTAAWQSGRLPQEHSGESVTNSDCCSLSQTWTVLPKRWDEIIIVPLPRSRSKCVADAHNGIILVILNRWSCERESIHNKSVERTEFMIHWWSMVCWPV